jgi:multiple sugar transport system permease protein
MSANTFARFLYSKKNRNLFRVAFSLFVFLIMGVFLMPLVYGFSASLKSKVQLAAVKVSVLPQTPKTFDYQGKTYDLVYVPQADGTNRVYALFEKKRGASLLLDPASPEAAPVEWQGEWRTLEKVWKTDPQWGNYPYAFKAIDLGMLFKNTATYAILSTIGAVSSALLVAYGFARFQFRGKKVLFIVLVATIILPSAVTLVPTYTMFYKLGWVGTWLPLIVPAFFGNAYNVFLLRQFIMGIPREMDEAARIDGAGPVRTLLQVIVPQAVPAIIAVSLFHFFFCWNDFFGPLIYLAGKPELQPITVGLSSFNNMYTMEVHLIQAATMMACIVPFLVFFFAQKFFMQGVVVTGVDK